jgi:hypothetical protein
VDLKQLKEKSEAARTFTAVYKGHSYTLRLPTRHETRATVAQVTEQYGNANFVWARTLLERALVGWTGPTVGDVLPDGGQEPLLWEPAAVVLLLDERPDIEDFLSGELMERIKERNTKLEALTKN